ncbi:MAG TPA: phospho-N-acetylmuramoyl-pentapeptide-transferase [Alphaproteobacteria bacterium]|nr:phospho-N-acetylmuramoyl-pentapeptide-transferase [Alphaproteobacteria bacterium]
MFYHLLYPLHAIFPGFNVFRYLTFRSAYAILTGLLICLILGPWLIRQLRRHQIGETIREDGPKSHRQKAGTPTMGGLLILWSLTVPTVLWADLTNRYIWLLLSATFAFGAIGFLDDWLKLARLRRHGMAIGEKLLAQTTVALGVALFLYLYPEDPSVATQVTFPFFKEVMPDLGWWYVPFVMFIIVGTCNAVNLTDGLDGLATGPLIIATFAFTVIAYVAGHAQFAQYLLIPYIKSGGEVAIFGGALIGASLGFLWFNAYPAEVFMGNIGSLALGGALGTMAVLVKHELLLPLVGGIFFIEALSVLLQILSFRLTGKRIFRMAPLHHHFEEKGWKESKVIVRFWIIAIVLALLSLSTLKLR